MAGDAGAPSGPSPAEELAAKKRAAQNQCDHGSFLLSQNKAPENTWAKHVKTMNCMGFNPDRPSCERMLCVRACSILNDQPCIAEVERLNQNFPPPF